MRPITDRTILAGLGLLLAAPVGAASGWRVELDPAATEIRFEVDATLHVVRGTARLVDGWLELHPASGHASGRIVVDATSLESGHAGRDAKMHANVLDSAAYPEIVFEARSVHGELPGSGEAVVRLAGEIVLLGKPHPLTVDVAVAVDEECLEASTRFELPYVAWGLSNPSRLFLRVAKQVSVDIEGFGCLLPSSAAADGQR